MRIYEPPPLIIFPYDISETSNEFDVLSTLSLFADKKVSKSNSLINSNHHQSIYIFRLNSQSLIGAYHLF